MDNVQMMIIAILIVMFPRKGTFIDVFKCKLGFVEFYISTKEKSDPPAKTEHSNRK